MPTEVIYKSNPQKKEIIDVRSKSKSSKQQPPQKKPGKPPHSKATAKTAKVALVIDHSSIIRVDSIGFKQTKLTVSVENMKFEAMLNSKSYRKALAAIDDFGVENCNVILQGTMKEAWKLEGAGMVVQPKKVKESG